MTKPPSNQGNAAWQSHVPPVAKKLAVTSSHHGDTRTDPYAWLRDPAYPTVEAPDILAYLNAENSYRQAVLEPYAHVQEALFQELKGRIQEDDQDPAYPHGPFLYQWREEAGKQYAILSRRPRQQGLSAIDDITADTAAGAPFETVLDENRLAEGHEYFALAAARVSPDHALLAYAIDTSGDEYYEIHIRDLATGADLPDIIRGTAGDFEWSADGAHLFYLARDTNQRPSKLYHHSLGADPDNDRLIQQEDDPGFSLGLYKSRNGRMLFCGAYESEASEIRFLDAADPAGTWSLIAPRRHGHRYSADAHGGQLYILTNDRARTFRLVTAPITSAGEDHWQEKIAARPEVTLNGIDLFADYLVVHERAEGMPRLAVHAFANGDQHIVAMPESAYALSSSINPEFETDLLRFTYTSLRTPRQTVAYDMRRRHWHILKETEIPSGYDKGNYIAERLMLPSHDGVLVPVSLIRHKDTPLGSSAPLYLYAYGAYGISMPVSFSPHRLSLLDRGFIYAIAHVRGGAEMGEPWHDAGKLAHKENTFRDVVAVAESLIAKAYTSAGRITISGGSAGGLMAGAVINLAPDLFHAAVAKVPFVDTLNTMLDDSLPLTPGEFNEWGNPIIDADAYHRIKAYSPYDNLASRRYPHLYITGGIADPRVTYWEPAKWIAAIRAIKAGRTDDNELALLRMNMGAGHFGASGRFDVLKELAEEYLFLLLVYDKITDGKRTG